MKNMLQKIIVAATLFVSVASHAEFIHTDWKVEGDSRASLDTSTGIEWLKLNETSSMSYNSVSALLSTTYAGWRLPTSSEVIKMFNNLLGGVYGNASGTSGVRYNTINASDRALFLTYFGLGSSYSYGWFARDDALEGIAGGGLWVGTQFYTYWEYPAGTENNARGSTGVYLVNDGGVTLSSINNPTLNANNPNAPINQEPLNVNGPIAFGALLLSFMAFRKRSK